MLITLTLLFYTSLFLSLLVTGKSPIIAQWIGAVDHPDERKAHQHVTPRLGGIGFAAGLFVSLPLFLPLNQLLLGFLLGGLVIVAIGLWDDAKQISPRIKFLGQVIAVLLFVFIADVRLVHFGDLFGIGNIYTGSLALPITVVCMVGVINALNLSDGLDGLAGGLSAIAATFFAILSYVSGNDFSLAVSVALFAAILGFLRYNSYPAKLFMGDTGSLLLGYALASLAVLLAQPVSDTDLTIKIAPITIALVLLLPIADTILVMLRRLWYGHSPFLPDKTHLHHRLMDLGFPHAAVVPILYMLMVAMGALAVSLRFMPEWVQLLLGLLLIGAAFLAVTCCQRCHITWQSLPYREDCFFQRTQVYYNITAVVGRSMPLLLIFIVVSLSFPVFFVHHFPGGMEYYTLAVAALFVILFPWQARHGYNAIVHGLLYLSCVVILLSLNVNQYDLPWISLYLKVVSSLVLVWVLLKLIFKSHGEVFLTSGFELLLIFISWFIPMIVLPQLHASESSIQTMTVVCIEAIPFFLALKILIREQPFRNRMIALCMLLALMVLSARGIFLG